MIIYSGICHNVLCNLHVETKTLFISDNFLLGLQLLKFTYMAPSTLKSEGYILYKLWTSLDS